MTVHFSICLQMEETKVVVFLEWHYLNDTTAKCDHLFIHFALFKIAIFGNTFIVLLCYLVVTFVHSFKVSIAGKIKNGSIAIFLFSIALIFHKTAAVECTLVAIFRLGWCCFYFYTHRHFRHWNLWPSWKSRRIGLPHILSQCSLCLCQLVLAFSDIARLLPVYFVSVEHEREKGQRTAFDGPLDGLNLL